MRSAGYNQQRLYTGTFVSSERGSVVGHDLLFKRNWIRGSAVLATAALSLVLATPARATPLAKVTDAVRDNASQNVVNLTFKNADGTSVQGRITFLEDDLFRYNVDPSATFDEYAKPISADHTARIQAQPDSDPNAYTHPAATVTTEGNSFVITSGNTTIKLDKTTATMQVLAKGKEVVSEATPLDLGSTTVQSLTTDSKEFFFGGGTQNGRFTHKGKTIKIENTNNWVDGGVASPNPFYWSSDGYGVLRNTFKKGSYDFGESDASTAKLSHEENEFDAYYFLSDGTTNGEVAQDVLDGYFDVTGNPVLLPEYGFYLGHLNAYNRDSWTKDQQAGGKKWETKGGKPSSGAGNVSYEYGMSDKYVPDGTKPQESLNGHGPTVAAENFAPKEDKFSHEFSAQQVIDDYQANDMPLGWFLPNDGYGAGYGQNGYGRTENNAEERNKAIDENVANLREFTNYANARGVATGLWTQSNLEPINGEKWHLQRDFKKEVENGGISTLKTDVAWVGSGYSFGLNGIKKAYDIATSNSVDNPVRPNIVTLDGWAGTQRYGGIWTGDQTGGKWEYIRFHIPTYIGQGLSGNPNIGSDMDGIFGGAPIIATRDYQWKTFTPTMLDMDGWGAHRKSPMTHGDPYTGISRMYLKLKAQLMPYIYTSAASAANINTGNGDTGMPMIRAMMLTDDSEYAVSTATQYQYTFGKHFLVAPVYQNTADPNNTGNDVRNGIYLPNYGTEQDKTVWIDYFTGKQYLGGQVLNNFDAPLWKLPLFVQAGAIVPMYEENNNPQEISKDNPKGLDKTRRIVEFWPEGSSEYTLFEDDGETIDNTQKTVDGYGVTEGVKYGDHVSTKITSEVKDGNATLTIGKSTGGYTGYDSQRSTTAVVNVSKAPAEITYNGTTVKKVDTKTAFDAAKQNGAGAEAVWYYEQAPDLNTAPDSEEFGKTAISTTPKVYIFLPKTDVAKKDQVIVVKGFENKGNMGKDVLNTNLKAPELKEVPESDKTPTSIKLTWDKAADATSYDIMIDGTVNNVGDVVEFNHTDLAYNSTHTYKIRSRNAEGYSDWSAPKQFTSLQDPWRNAPKPAATTWEGGYYAGQTEKIALDHDLSSSHFHSDDTAIGKALTLDYGKAMELDKFEYYPRLDAGNGTVTKMRIETSLDGNHWSAPVEFDWQRTADVKTYAFPAKTAARYVRLTPLESIGNFFSARELVVYKKDGTKMWEVGSSLQSAEVSESDYSNMKNYLGLENRGGTQAAFASQIAAHYADLNNNGVYDVYDYSFTTVNLDGGTRKSGKVAGTLAVVPDKDHVSKDEIVTVSLYASDVKNANALGAIVNYQNDDFELVDFDPEKAGTAHVAGMDALSAAKSFDDGKNTVNLAFANRGDKELFAGSETVATFQLKAKREADVKLPYTSMLIGPGCDCIEQTVDGTGAIPAPPTASIADLGMGDLTLKITNSALPTDDKGANVGQMIHGGKFDPLFDDVDYHDGNSGSGCFELEWGGSTDIVSIKGMNIEMKLNNPRPLKNVEVLNRQNKDGVVPPNSNGYLKKLAATITFTDGSNQEFAGGELDTVKPKYVLEVNADNAKKDVAKVEIKPLETNNGDHMLTISEVNLNYMTDMPTAQGIELGKHAEKLFSGDVSEVKVTVTGTDYGYYIVTSGDPAVASVSNAISGTAQSWFVTAKKAGTTKITVASALDKTKTATYTLTVADGVDTTPLEEAIARANGYSATAYTPESYAKLGGQVKAAQDLIGGKQYTKDDIVLAARAIDEAIAALKMRPVNPDNLINTEEHKGDVRIVASSSHAHTGAGESPETAEQALDYNTETHWQSDWSGKERMPQWVSFDLGATYNLTNVTFLPRQKGNANGDVFRAEVLVTDVAAEAAAGGGVSVGVFTFDNNGKVLADRDQFKQMAFGAATGRYVTVKVLNSGGGVNDVADKFTSMSEVRFYGEKPATPQPGVDLRALEELVKQFEAEGLKAEDYTEATWGAYASALATARNYLASAPTDQTVVNTAVKALQDAHDALVKRDPVPENPSKDDLRALVEKAEKTETVGKPADVVEKFTAALNAARELLDDPNATAEQIADVYIRLNDALATLNAADGTGQGGNGGAGGQGNQNGAGGQNGAQGGSSGFGNGSAGNSSSGAAGGLPSTGDAVMVSTAATSASGLLVAAWGFLRRRKIR